MKGRSSLFSSKQKPVSADLIFNSQPESLFKYIAHRNDVDPNGYVDIVAHGTSQTIQIEHEGHSLEINWRALASLIKHDKTFKGKSIRLLSCCTGSDPNGFAQNLANKLGVKVLAPNKVLWCWPNGVHIIASRSKINKSYPDLNDRGEFVEFIPGGNKKWKK
ncbi:MAG: hypothetical protein ACI4QP_06755 [Candidatus Enteromonas sp.]